MLPATDWLALFCSCDSDFFISDPFVRFCYYGPAGGGILPWIGQHAPELAPASHPKSGLVAGGHTPPLASPASRNRRKGISEDDADRVIGIAQLGQEMTGHIGPSQEFSLRIRLVSTARPQNAENGMKAARSAQRALLVVLHSYSCHRTSPSAGRTGDPRRIPIPVS